MLDTTDKESRSSDKHIWVSSHTRITNGKVTEVKGYWRKHA